MRRPDAAVTDAGVAEARSRLRSIDGVASVAAAGALDDGRLAHLDGTFSVLMTLPVTFAFNIGFMVAVGILLDTFVVRTVMVSAAVELLGDRVWWPRRA